MNGFVVIGVLAVIALSLTGLVYIVNAVVDKVSRS